MLSRTHRFHGSRSLRFVYSNGSTQRGPWFSIKWIVNPRGQSYRLAVVVSRKVHKSAVDRNRLRRRIYEIVHEIEEDIIQPYDIVVTIFSDELLDKPYKDLSAQVKKQLREAGILAKRIGR